MEEGRKFNTNYPTNKPSSFIHYPLSNKKSGRCLPDFFVPMRKKFSFSFWFSFFIITFAHGILNDILKMLQYNSIFTPPQNDLESTIFAPMRRDHKARYSPIEGS